MRIVNKSALKIALCVITSTSLWGVGCSPNVPSLVETLPAPMDIPTPTELVIQSQEAIPTMHGMPGGGPCSHLLWPLWDGGQWAYQWEGADRPPLTLHAAVQDASATATLTWNGASGTLHCTTEGLVGLPPLAVIHPTLGTSLVGENVTGAFLPTLGTLLPLAVESTWDAEYTLSGPITLPLVSGPVEATMENGRLVIISRTLPPEVISLPFGQLNTLPVEQFAFVDARVALPDGTSHGITIDMLTLLYYAEEIGLMRIRYEGGTIAGLPQGSISLPNGLALVRSTP